MNNSISNQQYNQVDSEEDDSDSLDDLNVNDSVHSRPEKLHGQFESVINKVLKNLDLGSQEANDDLKERMSRFNDESRHINDQIS